MGWASGRAAPTCTCAVGGGTDTHGQTKTGDSARHGPYTRTYTHPDIDMEAEKRSRKEEKGRGGEEEGGPGSGWGI